MVWFVARVFFFYITLNLADAECHCATAAACAEFPSTPCSQAAGPDRCQEGWFGSYCQKRNIALGRNATQSSTYTENSASTGYTEHRFEARYGVDGRATTDFYSKPLTCTATHPSDQQPTWIVHLNNSNTDKIQHIKLHLRQSIPDRNNGMKIYVGGQLCFQWSRNTHPPAVADVRCQQALTGNDLTIQTSDLLILCEVQIFVCSGGWFGEDCDKQCHCSVNTEVCEKITGHCLSGCVPGYMGIDCQSACPDGTYGDCTSQCGYCLNAAYCNKATGICPGGCAAGWQSDTCLQPCPDGYYGDCNSQCGHCYNAAYCNKVTGICPRGCAAGWQTDTCLQPCQDGWYGMNCASQCGNCLDEDVCNKSTGICSGGCAGGWMNDTCNNPCPSGYYGPNCGFQCGKCVDGDVCMKTNGTCPAGCTAGWINDTCNQACPDGDYGPHCTSKCGHCLDNDVCNKTTGTCPRGCAAGWMDSTCHNMCEDGRHGFGCMSECGHCKNDTVCDKTNGTCLNGCDRGYSGARCEHYPATSGYSNVVVPVAATLGGLLVLALIALLTSIIYNRRLRNQLDALQKKPEDNYISLDVRTKDPIVENTYEQIKSSNPYINEGEDPQGRI